MQKTDIYEVTIIGGGPAGLYSAFYSGLRGLKTKIIECQQTLGGKLNVFPEKIIWDIGALPPTPGYKVIENLVNQALTFDPTICLSTKITSIEKDADGLFICTAENGEQHLSKTIICAIGGGVITPQKLEIDGAERYELTNLHYTVKTFNQFKDKTVVISGGGNSAVDWALELQPIAKKVIMTYRKDELTGHEAQVAALKNSNVDIYLNTTISKLIPNDEKNKVAIVELAHNNGMEKWSLPVDEIVINHGYFHDNELLKNSPLSIAFFDNYFVETNNQCCSSIDGLYAAGDIAYFEGKIRLIAGTFFDALNAVNQVKLYLEPTATTYGMVSSHNDLFEEKNKEIIQQLVSK